MAFSRLDRLSELLKQGEQRYGFDFSELIKKIVDVQGALGDGLIRIALVGSFSEGKTSIIAGLLGKTECNMKIDNDESSDEIVVYKSDSLEDGFEFVDTPGLFGSKEKFIEGRNVKFSDVTEKYLSEAHLILFVCDAVNPLKESHIFVIEHLLRKLNKLDSTIFVINKLDQAGVDVSDEADFTRGAEIKRTTLVKRLKDSITLTPEEESKLNIVCIAADPGGEGVEHWLETPDEYETYSHIELLKEKVNSVTASSDKSQLQLSAVDSSLKDIVCSASREIQLLADKQNALIEKANDSLGSVSSNLKLLKKDLTLNRGEMDIRLKSYKAELLSDIDNASLDTISSVLEDKIGIQEKEVTFYVFNRTVNQILKECSEANDVSVNSSVATINKQFSYQSELFDVLTKGISGALKNANISGDTVKAIRDVVAKNHKFRPWRAIKLGDKATKWLNRSGNIFAGLVEVYKFYSSYQEKKKFEEMRAALKGVINNLFANISNSFNDDETYYNNFAPSFLTIRDEVNRRKQDLSQLQEFASSLHEYGQVLIEWAEDNSVVEEQ